MKKITIYKNQYTTYKDFYKDIFIKLDGKNNIDFQDMEDLLYNPNILSEFLWYSFNEDLEFTFVGFNLEKLENCNNYEDYEWSLIINVFKNFVKKYPNNKLEFINK